MRFEKLYLTRFGRFTDFELDFGQTPERKSGSESGSDFHIVYGPNEAGKSTLRDACIDFLYGIPGRTKYNFIHDYSVMEIGACLNVDDVQYQARRIKGNKNTLINVGDAAFSDSILNTLLGPLDRDGYEQMYSINEDSLQAGGESILNSKGELGALLFGAMSGLPDVSIALGQAKANADNFYRASARNTRINQLKNDLKALEQQIQDSDVDVAKYTRLNEKTDIAKSLWQKLKTERDEQRAEQRKLQSMLDAFPVWQDYIAVQNELQPLSDAPNVPDGWIEKVDQLIAAKTEAGGRYDSENRAVSRLSCELETSKTDPVALSIADSVGRLQRDNLEAGYNMSFQIETLTVQLQQLQQRIGAKLRDLGQSEHTDPQNLFLTTAKHAEISELLESVEPLENAGKTAAMEWHNAREITNNLREQLASLTVPALDLAILGDAMEQARRAPQPEDLYECENTIAKTKAALDASLARLHPWLGDLKSLQALQLPSSKELQLLQQTDSELLEQERTLNANIQKAEADYALHKATAKALITEAKVITDEQLQQARDHKESAWQIHRISLDQIPLPAAIDLQQTADTFHRAITAYERLLLARQGQSTKRAQLEDALVAGSRARELSKQLNMQLDHLGVQKTGFRNKLVNLYRQLQLPEDFDIQVINSWLDRFQQALAVCEQFKSAEKEYFDKKERHQIARSILENSMGKQSQQIDALDWFSLLNHCQRFIDKGNEIKQQKFFKQESLAKAEGDERRRRYEHESALAAKTEWKQAWLTALDGTWLAQRSPAAVGAILKSLELLYADFKELSQINEKIEGLLGGRQRYCEEVKRLAATVGEKFEDDNPVATADQLRDRVASAERKKNNSDKIKRDLVDAEQRLAQEKDKLDAVEQEFKYLAQQVAAENLEQLRTQLQRGLQRARIEERLYELERDILRLLDKTTIEDCLAVLDEQLGGEQALEDARRRHESISNDLLMIDEEVSQRYADFQELQKQLDALGSDSSAAQLVEQKQTLLLQIENEAHAFMRLSAGILMASEALHRYRETHRSSMLQAASDAFKRITREAFVGLESASHSGQELLFGKRANGATILASEMSRGTRFQLYLALRIAGHAELAQRGAVLPFFADDILEPFDDDRSVETFGLLNNMAKAGQVVYLTHHRHLCELAREVTVGNVKIHFLPAG